MSRPVRAVLATLVTLVLAAILAGCGSTSLLGAVTEIAPGDRGAAIALAGTDLDGKPIDLTSYRGKPVVVVVWGAWCVDCQAEADEVNAAAAQLGSSAQFVGIDIRDASVAQAQAYVRQYQTPFPSIYSNDAEALLAFPGSLSVRTVPEFAVLDAQGRVAASIVGKLPSTLTLVEVVQGVDGGASSSPSSGSSVGAGVSS